MLAGLSAEVAFITWNMLLVACLATPRDANCSIVSGKCPNTGYLLVQLNTKARTAAAESCCTRCGGMPFCSLDSGNCYGSKRKDYYESCPVTVSCCAQCDGLPFCSPVSKHCYASKRKDYYTNCSSEVQSGPQPALPVDPEALLNSVDSWMLARMRWTPDRQQLTGLLKTYDGFDRHDAYDNALAAIYLTMRGKLREAKAILDFFIREMYVGTPQGVALETDSLPSNRSQFALLIASYGDMDTAVDVGNNAWVGIAFARYAAASGSGCYALVAHDILAAIHQGRGCSDSLGGFMQRLRGHPQNTRSTEHNIDMKSLARMLHDEALQASAESFIGGMHHEYSEGDRAKYLIGTDNGEPCNARRTHWPGGFITDTTFWNVLADGDVNAPNGEGPRRMAKAVGSALQEVDETDVFEGHAYRGVRFTSLGSGIQWENTASAALAMAHLVETYPETLDTNPGLRELVQQRLDEYRSSIKAMLSKYGFMYASVHEGGSDTGIGWTYFVKPHLAATAWAGMMLVHQAGPDVSVNESGNPYAPPPQPVPTKTDVLLEAQQCIDISDR
eukprot:TRINITY_DN441_c0_g1_i2.p1 TRINITY_DN441_c0_g1~~TRINITY_DN441_c0_g1_i2.p1  ORF type:complete len:559 (-),score=88.37 TRINITY_DN441_c0_g1_i2:206-1882(-)